MPNSPASCPEWRKLSLPLSTETQLGISAEKYRKNYKTLPLKSLKCLSIVAWFLSWAVFIIHFLSKYVGHL